MLLTCWLFSLSLPKMWIWATSISVKGESVAKDEYLHPSNYTQLLQIQLFNGRHLFSCPLSLETRVGWSFSHNHFGQIFFQSVPLKKIMKVYEMWDIFILVFSMKMYVLLFLKFFPTFSENLGDWDSLVWNYISV